jgi:hypothetical protein
LPTSISDTSFSTDLSSARRNWISSVEKTI